MKTLEERKKTGYAGTPHEYTYFKFTNKKDLVACIEDITGLKEGEDYIAIYSGGQAGDGLHIIIIDTEKKLKHLHNNTYISSIREPKFHDMITFLTTQRSTN